MAETLLSLVNGILLETDEDEVSTVEGTTLSSEVKRIKRYINNIYRELFLSKPDWSWSRYKNSFTTVSGTSAYSLNAVADVEKLHMLQINNEPTIELLSYGEFKRKYAAYETDTTGKPFAAYVLDGQVYLYPVPGEAYTVNYICNKLFLELTTDSQEPYIPDGKRHVLYYGALAMRLRHEGEDARDVYQLYQKAVQDIRNSENNNHKGYAIIPEEETVTADYYESILLE